MERTVAQPLDSLAQEVNELQVTVRELAASQARLEAERDKADRSLLSRMTVLGTTLALAISLITGGFTVYDQLVTRRIEARLAMQEQLREVAAGLNQLQEDAVYKLLALTDPIQRDQAQRVLNTRSELLLQKGRALVAELGDDAGITEMLVLGWYEISRGNPVGGRAYLEQALRQKAISEIVSAEIHAQLGQFHLQPGDSRDPALARGYFQKGLDVLSKRNGPMFVVARAQYRLQWAAAEAADDTPRACELLGVALASLTGMPAIAESSVRALRDLLTAYATNIGCPASPGRP
ncbi:MAG TPA: hypothetical protein PKA13_08360 [Geminicoccaceae bacterium]|nr:hypothetical protein [Geminicoccus sp.]HMU49775.1 hypothetical protein [Geminicoccaceae bacterium]